MKTFNLFVVELKKLIKDTIKTKGGLELYVDNRFKEFEHRINEGPVVAVPFKFDTGVEEGDTLYFHHHVVINNGQPLTGSENHFLVMYDDNSAVSNQAIAYKCKETGKITPLSGWTLLEELEKKEETIKKEDNGLYSVELKDAPTTKARVAFESKETEELGLKVGDIVGFKKGIDYRFKIDEKEYIRIPTDYLLYAEVSDC